MNLIYDIKNNTGSAKKVLGKTNYYVGVSKICARCGRTLTGYPALSRKDNKTEICSECGLKEALDIALGHDEKLIQEIMNIVLEYEKKAKESKEKQ